MGWRKVEDKAAQIGKAVTEAGQNFIKENIDEPTQAKLAALRKAAADANAAQASAAGLRMPPPARPNPDRRIELGPSVGPDGRVWTMDEFAADRKRAAELDAMNPQIEEIDPSTYTQYKTTAQRMAEQRAAPPPTPKPRFQALQKRLAPAAQEIPQRGMIEVTPEVEAQLGFASQEVAPVVSEDVLVEDKLNRALRSARNP